MPPACLHSSSISSGPPSWLYFFYTTVASVDTWSFCFVLLACLSASLYFLLQTNKRQKKKETKNKNKNEEKVNNKEKRKNKKKGGMNTTVHTITSTILLLLLILYTTKL